MEFISDILGSLGSGIVAFVTSIVQAIVPNFESLIYQGSWVDGVWTRAADGGYTALFGFTIFGIILGVGTGLFRLIGRKVG